MAKRKREHFPVENQTAEPAILQEEEMEVTHQSEVNKPETTEKTVVIEETKQEIPHAVVTPETATAIIGKTAVKAYRIPSLESRYLAKTMPAFVALTVAEVVNSRIYGKFYKLTNGYFVPVIGDYILKG